MKRADELEFLKWWFCEADFGPAEDDVRFIMQENFETVTGKKPPLNYDMNEDE